MDTVFHLNFCSRTHTGKVRRNNEDALFIDKANQIVAIADGMGGEAFGEVASQLAVDACVEYLQSVDVTRIWEKPGREIGNAVRFANEAIIAIQRNEEKYRTMGTTLTCMMLLGDQLHYSWVGDSRLYRISRKDNVIQMLTRDHTLDRSKIDPKLAPDLYRRAPSILTQKVGSILLIQPDTGSSSLLSGDLLLMCTDGLTDRVPDPLLLEYACVESSLDAYADRLLERALDCGGQDNISFVLVEVVSN
jgi:protein phosphatase